MLLSYRNQDCYQISGHCSRETRKVLLGHLVCWDLRSYGFHNPREPGNGHHRWIGHPSWDHPLKEGVICAIRTRRDEAATTIPIRDSAFHHNTERRGPQLWGKWTRRYMGVRGDEVRFLPKRLTVSNTPTTLEVAVSLVRNCGLALRLPAFPEPLGFGVIELRKNLRKTFVYALR
jgi:hypothetical protein